LSRLRVLLGAFWMGIWMGNATLQGALS